MYGTCYHFILAKYTIFILAILLINSFHTCEIYNIHTCDIVD